MSMQKRWIFIFLLFFSVSSIAKTNTASTETEKTAHCLQWKQVCYRNTYCTHREGLRKECYHCVKPTHFGTHLYPRKMERTTCNPQTVEYLRNMQYRCYK